MFPGVFVTEEAGIVRGKGLGDTTPVDIRHSWSHF